MDYEQFISFLEKRLHVDEKKTLLRKLAENPDRFVGTFRASNPKTKLNQFVTQSREIKFGDAIEEAIEYLLADMGYQNINKRITGLNGEVLNLDQYFTDGNTYYFVEQKIRDDHDSTKKRGQIDNFKKKYEVLKQSHGNVTAIMYFIDPSLTKNQKYYLEKLGQLKQENDDTIELFYGEQFFHFLNRIDVWNDLIHWLETYRNSLPELFDLNFDSNSQEAFEEIITMEMRYWRKLISEDRLWETGLLNVLFASGETLSRVVEYFHHNGLHKESALLMQRLEAFFKPVVS